MAEQWYYAQQGQRKGPVPEEQIRQLLSSNQIRPTNLVWKKGLAQWTQASHIFPPPLNAQPSTQSSTTQQSRDLIAQVARFWENPIFIGVLLLFCFPIGLFLVWKHSTWANGSKWIWTAAWIGVMLIGFIGVCMEERETAQTFAEANALWDSGKKTDAVDRYRVLLGKSYTYLTETDRPLVFRRVIEFDAEQGNADEAKTLIAKALDNNLALSLESPKAVALLTQVKDEKETRKKRAEEERRLARQAERQDKERVSQDENISGRKGNTEATEGSSGGASEERVKHLCSVLVKQVHPGMSFQHISTLMGSPHKKIHTDLSAGGGPVMETWVYLSASNKEFGIVLTFEEGILRRGGTPGYDIVTGRFKEEDDLNKLLNKSR